MIRCKLLLVIAILLFSLTLTAQNGQAYLKLNALVDKAENAENACDVALATKAYEEAIDLCRSINDTARLPILLYSYGRCLCYNGSYNMAIEASIEAYELSENKPEFQARSLMMLGIINFFMEKWDEALAYYQRAEKIASSIDNLQGVSIAENNIANIYQKKHDYKNAIKSYNKSLEIQETLKDTATICNTYFNLATCNYEIGNIDKSETMFVIALHCATSIHEVEIMSLSKLHLGDIKIKKGLVNEGFAIIDEAETLAKQNGYETVLSEIFRRKSENFEHLKMYNEALAAYKGYKVFSDSLINIQSIAKLNEFKTKYETLEKDHQIAIHQATINRQKIQRFTLIICLVLCLSVLVLLFRLIKILRERNRVLVETGRSKDKFLSIISHDLKNPAIAQRNALQSLIVAADFISPSMLKEQGKLLLQSAESQLNLLHNLLSWSRLKLGRMPYDPIRFDLKSAIAETTKLLAIVAETKNISIVADVPDCALVFADRNMISTILRNILSNALKFSFTDTVIHVDVKEQPKFYELSVVDFGIGMTPLQVQNLFNNDHSQSVVGTNGEVGSGLGLSVCKDLVERNGGKIFVSSVLNSGSTFTFTVNKSNCV